MKVYCRVNVLIILEYSRVKVKQVVAGINNASRYFPVHRLRLTE